jgi:membrane-associated phospholipid phosphatase
MKRNLLGIVSLLFMTTQLEAQVEPTAGTWKTWFIKSVKDYRLPPPAPGKAEITKVVSIQQDIDSAAQQQILFWNAGAPGYRWQEMMSKLWTVDTSSKGVLANMLLCTAIYDATIAAWDTKYTYKRPRPFATDTRVKVFIPKTESPSYPCEHSVAAGVAATIIGHFYPAMADSVKRLAEQLMASRVAAGVAFPSDTNAGFELGKKIALKEIEQTKEYVPATTWDGKMPAGERVWKGNKPMFVLAGRSQTVVLDSSSQFRPGPPPDFAKDMAELKNFKQTFRSQANAFYYASQWTIDELLHKKIFEYNLHLNPPRAARIYATNAVATYDGFVACWDAKYAYWGIRPDQYDTTFHPLVPTPPFPGYPSGHAMMSGVMGELYSYFFPAERALFQKKAKEGAESRFQAGIHFRSDNDAALELGRKVAEATIARVKKDGADDEMLTKQQRTSSKLK